MHVNVSNVRRTTSSIGDLFRRAQELRSKADSPLNSSFSSVSGIDHVGGIHQRVLDSDPGSARVSLLNYAEQVEWLFDSLGREARGFQAQEDANSRGMEIADAGGDIGVESMPIMNQPEPGYSPFGFSMPVVNVGTDIVTVSYTHLTLPTKRIV